MRAGDPLQLPRRSFIWTTGVTGVVGLSGCLEPPSAEHGPADRSGAAAFFALKDWANRVAGEVVPFDTPVEIGRPGHGWDPPADLVPELADDAVFVYLDSPDFQWAVDLADTLGEEYGTELIDALEAIPREAFLPFSEDGHADPEHHGFFDPHVWVDPVHADRIVHHLADRLTALYPSQEATFRGRADAYGNELAEIHESFQSLVATAELDVAVGVTHNSFRYLTDRYGIDLRTPVGVSPDAAPSIEDLAHLARTIEDRNIDTVLYDPFEAPAPGELPRGAQLLLAETSATEAMPVTSIEGLTPDWRDAGYGWIELMRQVNLPAFRAALRGDR